MSPETPESKAPPTAVPPPLAPPALLSESPVPPVRAPRPARPPGITSGSTVRLLTIGFLILLLLVPVFMIEGLLGERQRRRNEAVANITSTWGKAQEIVGPVLVVPYRYAVKVTRQQMLNGRATAVEVEETQTGEAYFLPQRLEIGGTLTPQVLHRGIYDAIVYRGQLTLSGTFAPPAFADLKVKADQVLWEDATVVFGVTDLRGVDGALNLTWGGKALPLTPGCRVMGFTSGLTAPLKGTGLGAGPASAEAGGTAVAPKDATVAGASGAEPITFSVELRFNGSGEIRFAPLGVQNEVKLDAPWPDPSFLGAFLPTQREVTADHFSAQWSVSYYGRAYPQQWTSQSANGPSADQVRESMFGVSLLNLVDTYRTVERTLKYAVLFIVLVFSAFFLFEVLSHLRLHPVQYILVGAALCLFYLGLLALSEVVSFGLAYVIGAALATLLIGFYSAGVLKSGSRGGLLTAGLALVYGFLYVVLQLQDYSLLMGTGGLFVLLAAIMIATRKMDWYARDAGQG